MNNVNETYSYKNLNTDTSLSNNYPLSLNHNYTYYTLNTTLPNSKNKYLANSKDIFNSNYNPLNYSRNNLGKNYIYNQRKVISLHKNMINNKFKKWKTFENKNEKSINLLYRNTLKNKLMQSKIYKLIEKTANENYLKEKRKRNNTFITTIEDDNLDEKENIINIIKDNEENKKSKKIFNVISDTRKNNNKNNKFFLDLNPSITNYDTKKEKFKINSTDNNSNNILSLTPIESRRNKSLKFYQLKNISIPCIKFNNSLNSLNIKPNHKNSLAQTCLAKLKIDAIRKAMDEHYKSFFEKREFPISLTDTMLRFYLRNQEYFIIFDDLTKKYLQFLSNDIKNNYMELKKLINHKENLNKENDDIIKQISFLDEQIKTYESFNNLYLSLKNKSKQALALSPKKSNQKNKKLTSKLSIDNSRRGSFFRRGSGLLKRRESNMKKNTNIRNSAYAKLSSINFRPRKSKELFKNTQEIKEIFEERDRNVFQAYQKYSELIYVLNQLAFDKEKERQKEEDSPEIEINNNIISKLKKELILLKLRNQALNDFKNALLEKVVIEKKEEEKKEKNKESKILRKLKEIILNPRLNLEKILGMKNIYRILKEKEFSDNIIYKRKEYTKEVFYLKILEFLYLKIEQRNNNYMKDKNFREKYIKIKTEREKELKFLKCEQYLIEEKMNIMKKNYEIMNKNNKIIVLRNRKFDPFYKKYIKDEIIKKRMKSKEDLDKVKLENENDKYNYYLYY